MLSPDIRPASLAARSTGALSHKMRDALVHVAEPLLEAHDGLAVGGEAEVAGLDDAGVYRPDGDLMHRRAFGRMERIAIAAGRRRCPVAVRMAQTPAPMVEPAPVIGAAVGLQPIEVADGALQPQRGQMCEGDRGKAALRTGQAQHKKFTGLGLHQSQMYGLAVAP